MLKEYHQLLSDSNFIEALLKFDREEAERFRSNGCPHCAGVLDRSDYERRPRGLRVELSFSQKRRISFCCRSCRRRSSPDSVFYVRDKVYSFLAIFLTLSSWSGREAGMSMRRACAVSGASEVTLMRWRRWVERFLASPAWKLLKTRVSGLLSIERFPSSLVREFLQQVKELPAAISAALQYLSLLSVRVF